MTEMPDVRDGSNPPVLLIHGFATSAATTWGDNGWIDLLTDAGREVLAVNLLGHGDAPKPHDPAAYSDLEGHVAAQLPADGAVDAIAFSLGARVLLGLAADDPGRFRRIVVAGVGANLFRREGGEAIAAALTGQRDPADPVARYFAQLAQTPGNDAEALAAVMRRDGQPLTPERLAGVKVPVLVVLGDKDFAGPPEPLVEALPDAQLTTLKGVDHFATPKEFRFIDAAFNFLGVQ